MKNKIIYTLLFVLMANFAFASISFSGYWALDSNVSDSSGNLYSGAASGVSALASGSCKVGTCYEWDGAGADFITLPPSPFSSRNKGTIGGWIYHDVSGSENWFAKDGAAFRSQLYSNNTFYYQANGGIILGSSTTISTSTWYHVLSSWDGTRTWFYVNGVTSGNVSNSVNTSSGVGNLYLGQNSVNANEDWDGRMDEFFILNDSINTQQAACLYNSGNGTNYNQAVACLTEPQYNFSITANDTSTLLSINTFSANVTYNGSTLNYNTSSGEIVTNITTPYGNANITVYASGYLPSTYNNWATNVNLTANLTPIEYFSIEAQEANTSIINIFDAVASAGAEVNNYSTTDGTIITDIIKQGNLYNVTVSATGYSNNITLNHNTSNNLTVILYPLPPSQTATMPQVSLQYFNTTQIDLNDYFDFAFNYSVDLFLNTTTNITESVLVSGDTYDMGEYNVSLNGSILEIGAYNQTVNFSLLVKAYNINGVEEEGNRFNVIISFMNIPDISGLGFTFSVTDGLFWFFIILSAALLILTLTLKGSYIGYISGIYFFYYFIQFMLSDVAYIFSFIFLVFAIICIYKEISD